MTRTFREAPRFRIKPGFASFGESAGQIAIMHLEPVEAFVTMGRFDVGVVPGIGAA